MNFPHLLNLTKALVRAMSFCPYKQIVNHILLSINSTVHYHCKKYNMHIKSQSNQTRLTRRIETDFVWLILLPKTPPWLLNNNNAYERKIQSRVFIKQAPYFIVYVKTFFRLQTTTR